MCYEHGDGIIIIMTRKVRASRLTPEQRREIEEQVLAKWQAQGIGRFLRGRRLARSRKRNKLTGDELAAIRRWTGATPRVGPPPVGARSADAGGRSVRHVSAGLPESNRRKH